MPTFLSAFFPLHKVFKVCSCCSMYQYFILFSFFLFFFFLRASLAPYGSSQTRGLIRATAISLHYNHNNGKIWAASATYSTAHRNARSPTHWARPGIKPTSSWIPVGFVSAEPKWELLQWEVLKNCLQTLSNVIYYCPVEVSRLDFYNHSKSVPGATKKMDNIDWVIIMYQTLC